MTNKLYIFCGIPFAGKTTLARALEKSFGYTWIDLDEVKFHLFGDIEDSTIDQQGWDRVYQVMYEQIKQSLTQGDTVVQDAGNFTRRERDVARDIADNLGIEAITVFVDTPYNIAKERLMQNRIANQRFNVTDADFETTVTEMEAPDIREKHIVYTFGSRLTFGYGNTFDN